MKARNERERKKRKTGRDREEGRGVRRQEGGASKEGERE